LDVRNDPERVVALEAHDREIPSVECEDSADALPLGEMGEGGVGKVERGTPRTTTP
jgi:hypothetical protein